MSSALSRGIVIADPLAAAANVIGSTSGYLKESRLAVANSGNLGKLSPNPLATPESDVDVDLLLRTPGGAGDARWAWRNHDASDAAPYKGKTPASRLSDVGLIATGNVSTTRISKVKLLSLASGELLRVWVTGTDGSYRGTGVSWQTESATGLQRTAHALTTLNHVVGADVVQLPDTGEIVLLVLTTDSSGTSPALSRYVSTSDTEAISALPFVQGVCWFLPGPMVWNAVGFAIEIMPTCANRIAALIQMQHHATGVIDQGGGLFSTVSDNRGLTWSAPSYAGSYALSPVPDVDGDIISPYVGDHAAIYHVNQDPMNTPGGVAIGRARTGALVALAPAIAHAFGSGAGWTVNNAPRLRLLVSDDGVTWKDMVTASTAPPANPNVEAWIPDGLLDVGVVEGAVALGDDGLVRLFAALHGDPTKDNTSEYIYDELGLLTLMKPDITGQDVGRRLGHSDAGRLSVLHGTSGTLPLITVSDALEANDYTRFVGGGRVPDRKHLTFNRVCSLNAGAHGQGTNALTSSPTFQGVRMVDVVSHRGALVGAVVGQDDGGSTTSLIAFRANAWSEMTETIPEVTDGANLLRGRTFTRGYWPTGRPDGQGWTSVGTPGGTADTVNRGWKITTTATTGAYSIASLPGIQGAPAMLSAVVVPTSGGGTGGQDIAVGCAQSNGTNRTNLAIRFKEDGHIYVHDQIANADLGSVSGLSMSNGVEIAVLWTTYINVAVFYRQLAANPEAHGPWTAITLSGSPSTEVSAGDLLVWGASHGAATTVQTWRSVLYSRASVSGSNTASLGLNTYYTSPALEETDDPAATERIQAWDDGLRHGNRAPHCTAYPDQYLTAGQRLRWLGAAGVADPGTVQDNWRLTSSSPNDATRVRKLPVLSGFRSADCAAAATITFDAAAGALQTTIAAGSNGAALPQATISVASTSGFPAVGTLVIMASGGATTVAYTGVTGTSFTGCTGGTGTLATGGAVSAPQAGTSNRYRHNAVAFFGFNAPTLAVSYSDDPTFASGVTTIAADWTGGLDYTIGHLYKTSGFVVDAGGRRIRITDGANALTPGAYTSDRRQSWYLYSEALGKSFKVTGNDDLTILLNGDATGADAGGKAMVLYCDRFAFPVAGGSLGGAGYRYMRVRLGNAVSAETCYEDDGTHYRLGLFVPGRFYDLTDPHPDWGWTITDEPVVSQLDSGAGYRDKSQEAPRLRSWTFGMLTQFDALDRAAITSNPGNAAGFRRWLAALDAMAWGGTVAALLPEADNAVAGASDVFPVQFGGTFSGKHKAYDYRVLSTLTKAVLDVSGASFREVL